MGNYTHNDYVFQDTIVRYVILNDTKKVFMMLIPASAADDVSDNYKTYARKYQFSDFYDYIPGALCHLHLSHHYISPCCDSMHFGQSYDELYFKSQERTDFEGKTVIETQMVSDEGYRVIHRLTHYNGEEGFEVESVFVNDANRDFKLELLTSASLDNLSPYCDDDSSKNVYYHTFKSGWALEGRHVEASVSELNLGKSWGASYECYKTGTKGSRPTAAYFPYGAVEDRDRGVIWGMQLAHNASWQMEFIRYGRKLSLSCGIGDFSYSNWFKNVAPGEYFTAPKAYIAAVQGDIADLSYAFEKMHQRAADAYGEAAPMAITFNEWCTTWGKPSYENNLKIADKLKDSKVKYFVMDAGWFDGDIGDWDTYKKDSFPGGLKEYTDALRQRGFVPGIWFEFECMGEGAKRYAKEYDHMYLTHDGCPIIGQVNKSRKEKFLDFRKPEVISFLKKHVIDFLKENGFGYIKVDYNANIGTSVDGAESDGEALRQNQAAVRAFFKQMKKEIPDLVIENCSSGGMRLDASMMAVSAMASFSDAHESVDFPIVAANMHYLIAPRQSQIWCVLKPSFDDNRFAFTIAGGFMGRLCWSGDLLGLSDAQLQKMYDAEAFYEKVADIIRNGKSRVYRTDEYNNRYPEGTQAVLRVADDGERALLVYHCFDNPTKLVLENTSGWEVEGTLYDANLSTDGNLTIDEDKSIFGNVVLLKRK